jgi:hypothetical protein
MREPAYRLYKGVFTRTCRMVRYGSPTASFYGISKPMNFTPTKSFFPHSKSLIVHAFEKLATGNRYFWQISVNTPYWRYLR